MRISFRFNVNDKVWVVDKEAAFLAIVKKCIFDGKNVLYEVDKHGDRFIREQKNIKNKNYVKGII